MTSKRFAILLLQCTLVGLGLLLVLSLSAYLTMRVILTSQEVVVPSLAAKTAPEAGAIAARHGLALRIEGKRHDPKIAADRVVAQEPAAGSNLKSHRSVRVWLSLGPRLLVIPAVEGGSLRAARLALDQSQVPLARVVEVDDAAEEGSVLEQRPPPGEAEGAAGGVSLLVSRGPAGADYLMPDLIGREADAVLDRLRLVGLKVADVRYRTYPGVSPGIVLRQIPAAGHRVNSHNQVNLEISKVTP